MTTERVPSRRTRDVLLVRHGETDWNLQWRIQGARDVPLNETGRAQLRWTAAEVRDAYQSGSHTSRIQIWTSPILRAVQSAEILFDELRQAGLDPSPTLQHQGLGEFDMGDFVGRTVASLHSEPSWQDYIDHPATAAFPNGESMPEIFERVWTAFLEILAADADLTVIVSHGGPVRVLVCALLGLPREHFHGFKISNASITHVRLLPPSKCRLSALNRTPRLPPLL